MTSSWLGVEPVARAVAAGKAEVERIWLPYEIWLIAAWLPRHHRRHWLALQALTALTINHLPLTNW